MRVRLRQTDWLRLATGRYEATKVVGEERRKTVRRPRRIVEVQSGE